MLVLALDDLVFINFLYVTRYCSIQPHVRAPSSCVPMVDVYLTLTNVITQTIVVTTVMNSSVWTETQLQVHIHCLVSLKYILRENIFIYHLW